VEFATAKVMQIATVNNNWPWVCSVYFVVHNDKLYWVSEPHRRHSQEIIQNAHVAVAIVVKADMPVIGVQMEGEAKLVNDIALVKQVMEKYVAKYGLGAKFAANFAAGKNKHQLYSFTPTQTAVFDETT